MTPTVEELRRWSAEKVMGLSLENLIPQSMPEYDVWVNSQGVIQFTVNAWHPDFDLNQSFQMMEKLSESSEYKDVSWVIDSDNDNILDGNPRIRVGVSIMHKDLRVTGGEEYVNSVNEIAHAFLQAAYRAMEESTKEKCPT